jgi:hypothetical protein
MAARVPLDVDLEDKLVYGLTPTRLAYMAVALATGFALWSSHWAPGLLRGSMAAVVVGAGALAAWGRWRGRAADHWATDISVFVLHNYRVEWRDVWHRSRDGSEPPAAKIVDCPEAPVDLAA